MGCSECVGVNVYSLEIVIAYTNSRIKFTIWVNNVNKTIQDRAILIIRPNSLCQYYVVVFRFVQTFIVYIRVQ